MENVLLAAAIVKETFDKYAGTDSDKNTMTKKEFTEFAKEVFGDKCNEGAEEFFKGLDSDGDGVLNFEEFAGLLIAFCLILNDA